MLRDTLVFGIASDSVGKEAIKGKQPYLQTSLRPSKGKRKHKVSLQLLSLFFERFNEPLGSDVGHVRKCCHFAVFASQSEWVSISH